MKQGNTQSNKKKNKSRNQLTRLGRGSAGVPKPPPPTALATIGSEVDGSAIFAAADETTTVPPETSPNHKSESPPNPMPPLFGKKS
eukprot:CAMPEP_0172468908 /NCGR_PEP_ID=MMETSP1065-20121228/62423_1 /TAXON_ID=265537 /ORGANISM="Amphiprora paludosa, Strain CCMP125" /LENGTH=85 /DNA_ID=CAMNT_0013226407 /DNA_START=82 /DNA_END=336 /DNA_ORIENTATION=-